MNDFFDKVGTRKRAGVGATASSAPQPAIFQNPTPSMGHAPDSAARRWAANDSAFWGANQTYDRLPAGLYRCGVADNVGPILLPIRCDTDDLLNLPDSASNDVLDEIREFWQIEEAFRQRGFIHKRGVLLWGPPGSGKTATLQQLIALVINEHEGIAIFVDEPRQVSLCFQMVRKIEPTRPIVALLEDMDALVERHGENEYLALLDGEAQIANVVFVATTNYPERLDRRFVDRPSRFDTIRLIGMPTAAARRAYLQAKEPSLSPAELSRWVDKSEGFSIAHLRELIILCRCYHKPLEHAIERLSLMRSDTPVSTKADDGRGQQTGFLAVARGGK